MPNQETDMLLRNTLAEEGHPVNVPTGVVPRAAFTEVARAPETRAYHAAPVNATEVHTRQMEQLAPVIERMQAETQPAPKPNQHPAVWPLVMVDMAGRDKLGRERYGTPLQPHNGRDALRDAYEEALDLAVYLRTAMYERDGK